MSPSGLGARSDEELVRDFQRDPQGPAGRGAASELLGRYQRRVYLWCHRYARDPERALDLSQDVLTRAWRGLGSFGGRSKFSSWLFVIARNCCLNAVTAPALLRDDAELDALPSHEPGPAERFERLQDEEATRRLMMEVLDDEERRALWLSVFERLPVEEITHTMGLATATGARGLLQRARRKLRAAALEDSRGAE
jgi:RNA polymerase sigma-70 factor (ECF subfamily)